MASRPRLKPYFRPLRRGPDTVQLGLSQECGGVILSGLGPADLKLLERLDGSLDEREVYAVAAECGVPGARVRQLLELLREHGVLTTELADRADLGRLGATVREALAHDADILALVHDTPADPVTRIVERRRRHVVVTGTGRLPWSIAALLRSTGVGRVDLGGWAADTAEQDVRAAGTPLPHLVVLVAEGVLDPRVGEPWRRRDVPHLPVVSDGQRVVIGPLVGRDDAQPCLRCLEMSRAERDAAWPAVMAQAVPAAADVRTESTLVAIVSGVVAMLAHACIAGDPVPAGVSIEASMPWPRLDHRRWERHPACPGHRRGDLVAGPSRGTAGHGRDTAASPSGGAVPARATMTG